MGGRGFFEGPSRASIDPFSNLGGTHSFFSMFFDAVSGLGGFGHDDDFIHPMARGRQDKQHFHQRG